MKNIDRALMQKQIAAATASQDQLCFIYKKPENNEIVVRFATPLELSAEHVLCAQHLPKEGYRKFKIDNIIEFHRVITRKIFSAADKESAKDSNAPEE